MNIVKRISGKSISAQVIIFTDLDGSLLHPGTYSFEESKEGIELAHMLSIPVIFSSSKTRAEIERYREGMSNHHPFITENGGGIFIPEGYFSFPVEGDLLDGYRVIAAGTPYSEIRKIFTGLRDAFNAGVKGFGDLSVEEVAAVTGMGLADASFAKERDFDEPFFFTGGTDDNFLKAIESHGLRWTRGRFYHVMGTYDKGAAVRILKDYYKREYGEIFTIGIGDALNDVPMLLEADYPVLIRKEDGTYDGDVDIPGLARTSNAGPSGWSEAVLKLLSEKKVHFLEE